VPITVRVSRSKVGLASTLSFSERIPRRSVSEPTIWKIAAAFEKATHHRHSPPDFGPLSATIASAH